ncbi:WGR domain-containing protein [Leptospira weilii]|uniref:WGR domain-containing protein n=2 Tax=Leptospira weilii TaxID=28184 RepID=UPI000774E504|nr:WGR domain-containing protein [Leptospira weilii]
MQHYLTYKDETSDKFWNIEVSGTSFTVTYGKTGTPGQTQKKEFKDEATCLKEAKKLLTEKLKKGYIESEAASASQKKDRINPEMKNDRKAVDSSENSSWDILVTAKDWKHKLAEHFQFLASHSSCNEILDAMFQNAKNIKITENGLNINFKNGKLWCGRPFSESLPENLPASFASIFRKHNGILFEDETGLSFGFEGINDNGVGNYLPNGLIDHDKEFIATLNKVHISSADIKAPLCVGQDFYILDPLLPSANEPSLRFVSHENGIVAEPVTRDWNFGGTFLRLLAEKIMNQQVAWTNAVTFKEVAFDSVLKIKQRIIKGQIYNNKLYTIEMAIPKDLEKYYAKTEKRIACYDSNTGSELVSLALEGSPYDMVIHADQLFVFILSVQDDTTSFKINSYDISSGIHFKSNLENFQDKEIKSPAGIAAKCALYIKDSQLLFFFYGIEGLKKHDLRAYNLATGEREFVFTFSQTFINTPVQDGNQFYFYTADSESIVRMEISNNTVQLNNLFVTDSHWLEGWQVSGDFIYVSTDNLKTRRAKIAVFDFAGKRVQEYNTPSSIVPERFYVRGELLIADTGHFYQVLPKGALSPLKSNWKPKNETLTNQTGKITFDKNRMFIPRKVIDPKPGQEYCFEIFSINLK